MICVNNSCIYGLCNIHLSTLQEQCFNISICECKDLRVSNDDRGCVVKTVRFRDIVTKAKFLSGRVSEVAIGNLSVNMWGTNI